jgi:putative hydrolase of the HAD superfamily
MASLQTPSSDNEFTIHWDAIDTVLLDMDGTLLDLRFDNYFWLEWVPLKFGESRGMHLEDAQAQLAPRFAAQQGSLSWYCTDFWSRELSLDIAALKREAREQICWLPGAEEFLRTLRLSGPKRLLLVTNAHQDSLAIKAEHTGLGRHFDALVSSHQYGFPKEDGGFWRALESEHAFTRERTLFIDDSLPVLRAARAHGIGNLVAVTHPDSTRRIRECDEFPSVARVAYLTPSLRWSRQESANR